MTKKLLQKFQFMYDSGYRRFLLLPNLILIILYLCTISQMSAGSNNIEDSKVVLEDFDNYPKIVRSYNITDASTEGKECFPTKGKGVIFQRADGCHGSHHIWSVADKLTMNEYDNGTATIVGSVKDNNGKVGKVNIALYDKSNQGNTWEAECYQEGITDPRSLYQSFNGTITVDGKSFSVEIKDAKQHYILADGAGFEPGQFGFGAWTGGSFGGCTEWFGNLEPIEVDCKLAVDAGEDQSNCTNEEIILTANAKNAAVCDKIISSYKIIDSKTEAGCFSADPGVIFTKGQNCKGDLVVWSAKNDLELNEYDNGTAKISGSVKNQHGEIGIVDITLTDKEHSGTTWNASCYLDGISGQETFYRSFNGTITVNGVPLTVGTRFNAHYILANGAGFDSNQYGLGAWTGGSFGSCTEWFGNLVPKKIDNSNNELDYVWTTTDGNIVGATNTKTITVDKSGEYTVSVKDCEGCEASDVVKVTIGGAEADAGDDIEICKGDEAKLTVEGEGTYLWSTGETTKSIEVSPEVDTDYSVTVTNGECEATDKVLVIVGTAMADAGKDVEICKGDEAILEVEGEGTYLWSTGETTKSIEVSPEVDTDYSVTVTNGNCEATDKVLVIVGNATADAGDDIEICKGDEAILEVEGEGTYLWSTGEITKSIEVSPEVDTDYSVTVTNGNCEATDKVLVIVGNATADAGDDQTICEGEEVMLSVEGEGDYLWSTGEITKTIKVNPEVTTEYSVIVTNGNCEAMDDVKVIVDDKLKIGDYVWLDENRNGVQDDGATGIKGISVKLYQCDGDLIDSTETNNDGYYQFEVCPDTGDYYVVFGDVPEGLKFTVSNEGNDAMDSDADSAGRTSCFTITDEDDMTIDAGLIEICDIDLEVIEEVVMCGEQILELTATLNDNTEECEGGCEYPIIEQDRCYGPAGNFDVWLVSLKDGKKGYHRFKASEQRFETFDDGSARYTATATDGIDMIEVDVLFTDNSNTPGPNGAYPNECQQYDMSDWEYWSTWSGTVTSKDHGIFNLSTKGKYFQMGLGADVVRTGFGASGWFFADGGDGYYTEGDINVVLDECIEKSATFEWTTEDGNIISDANQKTISIDRPGTYVIEAVNCIDCVAVKTVVVTEDLICSIVMKSPNTPKMSTVYPVPVKSGGTLTIEFDLEDNQNIGGIKATSLKASVSGNSYKENVSVVLYDMTGRVISIPRTFDLVDRKAVIYLDLDYIPSGKYIVKAMGNTWNHSKNIIVR